MTARYLSQICLTLICLTLVACTAHQSPEQVKQQLMRRQQVKLHQRLFVVGMASSSTLDQATRVATAEITRQLTWLPDDASDSGLREMLVGMYRVDRSVTDAEGNVHVLAVLEREAASAHLLKEATERRAKVRGTLEKCEQQMKAGEVLQARACLNQAHLQVKQISDLRAASRAVVGDLARPSPFAEEQRAAALEKQLGNSEARRRSVLVHVLRIVDGSRAGTLNDAFRRIISTRGMRLASGTVPDKHVGAALDGVTDQLAELGKSLGAGYVVVGKVAARFSSEESGQYFAWASGKLRVIETTAGRTVGDLVYDKIKGGHISREQACDKAIDNVVTRLGRELQRKLATLPR